MRNTTERVRELTRRGRREQELTRLRSLVEEGLTSGPATPMTDEDWVELDAIADVKAGETGSRSRRRDDF